MKRYGRSPVVDPRFKSMAAQLRRHAQALAKTHREDARVISDYVDLAANSPGSKKIAALVARGLGDIVTKFEVSHPELAGTAEQFCEFLSRIGI